MRVQGATKWLLLPAILGFLLFTGIAVRADEYYFRMSDLPSDGSGGPPSNPVAQGWMGVADVALDFGLLQPGQTAATFAPLKLKLRCSRAMVELIRRAMTGAVASEAVIEQIQQLPDAQSPNPHFRLTMRGVRVRSVETTLPLVAAAVSATWCGEVLLEFADIDYLYQLNATAQPVHIRLKNLAY
ncbi:MAG: hypothetical protein EPO25_14230 [Gammaproteobacteria bacterium]|nr:MAG: hypothetical protein EPO25_14230 [Gammaproteobacteria bacterium]